MAAELITDLVSPKVNEQLEKLNQQLIENDANIVKAIDSAEKYRKILDSSKTIKEVRIATEALAKANDKVNLSAKETVKLEQEKQKLIKETANAEKAKLQQDKVAFDLAQKQASAIKKENQAIERKKKSTLEAREAQKQANKEARLAIALNKSERNSLERANILIAKYTLEKKKLNLATAKGRALNESYNRAIKNTNEFILRNADSETKRTKGIGLYSKAIQGLRSSFIGLIGAGAGIGAVFAQIREGLGDARVIEGVKGAFDRLNDPSLLSNLQEATKNTVNDLDLMKAAVQAKNLGVPIKELGTFFGFAQQRALETGESVDFLVDSIVKGIGRKSPLILDNLGISAIELKKNLDGVAIGQATTGQVAEAVGKIIQKQQELTGKSLDSNQVRLLKARAEWENTRTELGTKLLPVLTNVTAILTALGAAFLQIPLPVIVAGIVAVTTALIAQNKELIKSKILLLEDAAASLTLAGAKRTLTGALSALTGGFKAFFRILAKNPIIFIISAIAGLVLWIGRLASKNEEVRKSFAKVKDAVSGLFKAFEPIISAVSKFVAAIASKLGPAIEKLVNNYLVPLVNNVLPRIEIAFRFASGGVSAFVSIFKFALTQIKPIVTALNLIIKGFFTGNQAAIQAGIALQTNNIKKLYEGLGKAAKEGFIKGFGTVADPSIADPNTPVVSTVTGGGGGGNRTGNQKNSVEKRRQELLKRLAREREAVRQSDLLDVKNTEEKNRKIIDSDKASFEERLTALAHHIGNRLDIIGINEAKELDNADLTDQEKLNIQKKYELLREKALQENSDKRVALIKANTDKETQEILKGFDKYRAELDKDSALALRDLDKLYTQGLLSTEEYESSRASIIQQGLQSNLNAQIRYAEELLKDERITGDERIKLQEKVEALKNKAAKNGADIRTAILQSERQKLEEYLGVANQLTQNLGQILTTIADAVFESENARLEKRSKKLEEDHKEELRRIDQSAASTADKEKEKQRAEAITEAKRKVIDNERIQAERKRASYEKAANIASIISSTAVAVVKALETQPAPLGIALAATVGALGAAQLARAIAAPLPQYEHGTEDHPGGPAIVSEKGIEGIKEPGKPMYLTKTSTPTIMDLPKHTKVIPNYELMNYMYANPQAGKYTPTSTQNIVFDMKETNNKLDRLTGIMERKNTNVSFYGDANYSLMEKNVLGNG
jgi:hypothetical protein